MCCGCVTCTVAGEISLLFFFFKSLKKKKERERDAQLHLLSPSLHVRTEAWCCETTPGTAAAPRKTWAADCAVRGFPRLLRSREQLSCEVAWTSYAAVWQAAEYDILILLTNSYTLTSKQA